MTMLQKIATSAPDRRRTRERRQNERLDARESAVSILDGGGVAAALCGDLSQAGARLSLDRPLAVGEAVSIAFGAGMTLTARVAWVAGTECGIAFDQPIEQTLRGLPAKARDRRGRQAPAAGTSPRFREGLTVTVLLPDSERKAVLRWTDDNCANLSMA